ncbi:MAG: AbrB/MazE/SpoVT family DNA-binding domain-containing protein [Candidatus Methanoperedens sp.]|nr:AbrB/MazE/SpoVT family DNA-binding domain-containing protein [Candidatus Methanoperedens sp.]
MAYQAIYKEIIDIFASVKNDAVNTMEELTIDDTYNIHLPKALVDLLNIRPRDRFNVVIKDNEIILEKVKKGEKAEKDSLVELLESPAHVDIVKIKELNLNALEEELWTT